MKGFTLSIKPISVTAGIMVSENHLSSINTDNVKLKKKFLKTTCDNERKCKSSSHVLIHIEDSTDSICV